MMSYDRRDFLKATTVASLTAFFAPTLEFQARADAEETPSDEVGKPYVGWREGEYDIHFIHTGASENCFQIFPDGTTAIVDCGDCDLRHFSQVSWNPTKRDDAACAPMPNGSRIPSDWVARYIARLMPELKTIDYALASHFHDDHIGSYVYGNGMTSGRGEEYQLSGLANLGEYYRFGKAFDRGYPTYDQPVTNAPKDRENLRKFFDYKEKTDGLKREEFVVGAIDQIAPVKAPGKYDFHIRNLCRNGVVWSGQGEETIDYFAQYPKNKENWRNENPLSLATVAQFGAFRFYSGGDVCSGIKSDNGGDAGFEGAVGRAAGRVDVCKTNHHASYGAMSRDFLNTVNARVFVTCCWWSGHFNSGITKAMLEDRDDYRGDRLLLPTDPHKDNADLLKDAPYRSRVDQNMGHVVIKAYDGGARYKVYRLAANDESMRVERVFGSFESQAL